WWERVEQRHEMSGVGKLATPQDIFLPPDTWHAAIATKRGGDLEQLGLLRIAQAENELGLAAPEIPQGQLIEFSTQPSMRFHGSVQAMLEEVRRLIAANQRVIFAAPNTGEMERLADVFTEYQVPFRMGTRAAAPGSETYLDETAYFSGDLTTTTIVRAPVPDGLAMPGAHLAIFGARDLFDDSDVVVKSPLRQKSKTAAFMSDFRDLAVGDFVVHVEHGIGMYQGLKELQQGENSGEFMVLEFAEAAKLYVPLTRLDLIQKYRSGEGVQPPLSRLGGTAWAKTKARVKKAMKDMADELLKLYAA